MNTKNPLAPSGSAFDCVVRVVCLCLRKHTRKRKRNQNDWSMEDEYEEEGGWVDGRTRKKERRGKKHAPNRNAPFPRGGIKTLLFFSNSKRKGEKSRT